MRFFVHIMVFLLVSPVFYGCKKGHGLDCMKGTGEEVKQTRDLPAFSGLQVDDRFDVELIDSSGYKIELSGGEHLMKGFITEVEDGILYVRNDNQCNMVRSYERYPKIKVFGMFKDIWMNADGKMTNLNDFSNDTIFFHLTGNETELDLNSKFFFCDMYETGSLTLTGSCDVLRLELTSYGSFYGQSLNCKKAVVKNAGEGDLYVYASDTLVATIERVGNIYYSGNPSYTEFYDVHEGEIIAQ